MILISVSIKIPKSRYKIFFNKQSIHFLVAKESPKRNQPNEPQSRHKGNNRGHHLPIYFQLFLRVVSHESARDEFNTITTITHNP